MTARQQFDTAMWAARVFRQIAANKPAERVFWLQSALDSYKLARLARERMK